MNITSLTFWSHLLFPANPLVSNPLVAKEHLRGFLVKIIKKITSDHSVTLKKETSVSFNRITGQPKWFIRESEEPSLLLCLHQTTKFCANMKYKIEKYILNWCVTWCPYLHFPRPYDCHTTHMGQNALVNNLIDWLRLAKITVADWKKLGWSVVLFFWDLYSRGLKNVRILISISWNISK